MNVLYSAKWLEEIRVRFFLNFEKKSLRTLFLFSNFEIEKFLFNMYKIIFRKFKDI
jgi:hypothetical protein